MAKYSGHIHPFEAGQVITISGKASSSPDRIDIDLSSGNGMHNDVGDVQLHLSIRFQGAGEIVRNTHKRGGGWGQEERHENLFPNNAANPIRRGEDFKLAIYTDSNLFFVSINDKPFCYYAHRLPLSGVQLITINRDVDRIYQVDHITSPPSLWPRHRAAFSGFMPRQLRAGSVISFSLTPRGNRGSFIFNLRENGTDRILFHMRPYFNNGTIVINDQDANGSWRSELNSAPGALPMNQRIRFAVGLTNQKFVIGFNGRIISSFPFRENAATIFNSATGFEIVTKNGLEVEVHGVDHSATDANGTGFEKFCFVISGSKIKLVKAMIKARYSGHVDSFGAGQVITIFGKASLSSDIIGIDLSSGDFNYDLYSSDIQFDMAIRFPGVGEIVRNTHKRGGGWGQEERHENLFPNNAANPIRRGEHFKVAIYTDSNFFYVSVNDKPFCYYAHRLSLKDVQKITVSNDEEVERFYQVEHITSPSRCFGRELRTRFSLSRI